MPDSTPVAVAASVTVRVVYLARLRDAFGRSGETLTLPHGATVATALAALRAREGSWAHELAEGRAYRAAVNHQLAGTDAALHEGDELALLPPVTGG